jgi:hypothetical protein
MFQFLRSWTADEKINILDWMVASSDWLQSSLNFFLNYSPQDPFCGLVVWVPRYRSRGPGSIPGATRFPEK